LICPPPRRSFDLLQAKAFPLDDLGTWPELNGAESDKVLMRTCSRRCGRTTGRRSEPSRPIRWTPFSGTTASSTKPWRLYGAPSTHSLRLTPVGRCVTNGKPVLPRRCSDILLALLLKAYRQERYRERASVDMYLTDDLTALCSRSRLVPQSK